MLRFLELSEGVLSRSTGSTGAVIGVFERGAEQLGPLAPGRPAGAGNTGATCR
ncbi:MULTISPECIES: hypothetical protein [unclassified Synechococcus]|uniref:hypothetical protein n=1 Tax=unclassified Synechococcus TaxID=2626047 RepID=UPI0000698FE8|nr:MULTISPECIES: hypothetical protein [unclassified Synechococcus]EAQ74223.1 hypothetical protein WH5701_06316 [Synechococcus sp. WH 5701]WFN60016.1 hypothetical protein N4320_05440 [Synechococcus sp. CCFWC 502]